MADESHRGYKARFGKDAKVLRETTSEHRCDACAEQGFRYADGSEVKGIYTRVWVQNDRVEDRALYAITGTCPMGHDVERYGYGELPTEPAERKIIQVGEG